MAYRDLDRLRADWRRLHREIDDRLTEFRGLRHATDDRLFLEAAFCLFAIQTSARRADAAVRDLVATHLLRQGSEREVAAVLRPQVRFHNHKAAYLVAARLRFEGTSRKFNRQLDAFPGPHEAREWLVREIDGFGYKEASHFLRNVGRGEELAILDRHVLKNLRDHKVLRSLPHTLSRRRYLEIEDKVRKFAVTVDIPMAGLDLLFWSRESGEIFK